jgi:sugar phosphate isomerase/epimerase
MRLGTTTYGFRYALLDASRAPAFSELFGRAREIGIERLQVCENARPLALPAEEWKLLLQQAGDAGLEIQFGCMTLDLEVLARYLELAALTPARTLRIVLEDESGVAPARGRVAAFFAAAAPRLESSGIRLAVENHFHIPCRTLVEIVGEYPASLVGFCIDSANSLRCFESPAQVLDLLGSRAACFHLKDYRVRGSNVGFSVAGAPLGDGDLDAAGFLARVFAIDPDPALFIETWVPSTGDREADIAADRDWLEASLRNLKRLLADLVNAGRGGHPGSDLHSGSSARPMHRGGDSLCS